MDDEESTRSVSSPAGLSGETVESESTSLESGAQIGRYLVIDRLGAGGMGVVVRAYDPELNRRVALKLVRVRANTLGEVEQARLRLQREAQALAQVNHRNVVAVYDVGTVPGGNVFIAMEYVEGKTLGKYCRGRPWHEIVAVYAQVAAGLSACHREGLVHRDLKPSNVIVEESGRVVVLDFGLARSTRGDDSAPEPAPQPNAVLPALDGLSLEETGYASMGPGGPTVAGDLLSSPLTAHGIVTGTPPYMSPEQLAGREVRAPSDQFSFFVALYESLFGHRPFEGSIKDALRDNVLAGRVRDPPADSTVPGWLRGVINRGLSVDPQARWPSMEAVRTALLADPTRRRVAFAGVLGLGLLAVGVWGWRAYDRSERVAACEREGDVIETVWNTSRIDQISSAFAGTGLKYAPDTWARTRAHVDAYLERWRQTRVDVCVAGEVEHTRSTQLTARARACLDDRVLALDGLVEAWTEPDAVVVQKTVVAAMGLPRVEACVDEVELARLGPLSESPESRTASTDVRRQLAEVSALRETGQYREGLALAASVLEQAEQLDEPRPLIAARLALARAQERAGDYAAAQRTGELAFAEADAAGDDIGALTAAVQLLSVVGVRQMEAKGGEHWRRLAQSKVERAGLADDDLRVANLHHHAGSMREVWGDYDQALDHYEHALTIFEQQLGREHPTVASSVNNLGNVYFRLGDYEGALAQYSRALELREAVFGPGHPLIGSTLNNLGNVHQERGDYDSALDFYRRSLALREQILPEGHPVLAGSFNNIGYTLEKLGDYDGALISHQRALELREQALGSDHPDVALSLSNIGIVHERKGSLAEAMSFHRRALEVVEAKLGPEHVEVAWAYHNLGNVHAARGEFDEALAYQLRALAIRQQALGIDHPEVAEALAAIGEARLGRGEASVALESLQRAAEILRPTRTAPARYGRVLATLARATLDAGWDRDEALEIMDEALAQLERAPARAVAGDVAAAREWLEKHR